MTISATLGRYLERRAVQYELVSHVVTGSASETAQAAHISGDRIAKNVVLRDGDERDGYLLAVLPASHHLRLDMLRIWLGRPVALASEQEIGQLLPDCDLGAIPPLGEAYGLDVIVDEALIGLDEIWFEGGDHRSLVKVAGADFRELMAGARRGRFSTHD
jgi:Ala-tRNA(Pro) deacylase